MKRFLAAVILAIPFASAFADDPIQAEEQTIEAQNPYARFEGMTRTQIFNEAATYYNKRDYVSALPYFEYLATQGDKDSQYQAGKLYFFGSAGKKDDDMAIKYWTMAAEQGHGQSQFDLANLYYVREDYPNAIKYWKMAADNGFTSSLVNIGKCYDEGRGVDCDEVTALYWFQECANRNDSAGFYSVGLYYEQGKGGLPVDLDKALECYNMALSMGYANAQNAIERVKLQKEQ